MTSLPSKLNSCQFFQNQQKTLAMQTLNFSRSALFHIKTRVSVKYFVNDCLLKHFFASNSPQIPSNSTSLNPYLVTTFPIFTLRSKFGIKRLLSLFRKFSRDIKKFYPKYDCFQQLELLIKTEKAKQNFADNHFHNILRFFDVLPNFPLTTSETMGDYCL